ncbi:MAG: NAD-dependent epimerase/dehydratase family protein [Candidatus Melainabacteria bacterium]|nr:NAD-dependent epimerase/dehydratase family protein [Candidatus Melainabacteria bacterium]
MGFTGQRKTVLVTGASGMIGRTVVQSLSASSEWDIRAQSRNPQETRAVLGEVCDVTQVLIRDADFTRTGDREMRMLTKDCHTIIHCAGLVHRPDAPYQEYEVMNVRATQSLAEAAASNGVNTFIFLSTQAIYGLGPYSNIEENAPQQAKTPYAVSKVTSEKFLEMFRNIPKVVTLRPSLVYGEGDRGNILSMIKEIKSGRFVQIGGGNTEKSIIYSRDLAEAITLTLRLPDGYHTFNVSNPKSTTVKELIDTITDCLGTPKKVSSMPEPLLRFGVKAAELLMKEKAPVTSEQVNKLTTTTTCSVSKLVNATGFQQRTSLREGIRAEIAWATAKNLLT